MSSFYSLSAIFLRTPCGRSPQYSYELPAVVLRNIKETLRRGLRPLLRIFQYKRNPTNSLIGGEAPSETPPILLLTFGYTTPTRKVGYGRFPDFSIFLCRGLRPLLRNIKEILRRGIRPLLRIFQYLYELPSDARRNILNTQLHFTFVHVII